MSHVALPHSKHDKALAVFVSTVTRNTLFRAARSRAETISTAAGRFGGQEGAGGIALPPLHICPPPALPQALDERCFSSL
ncbi:hypothetical protein EVAR_42792_1 [Eumeta japonica]|uniref:Uncharacterized protein n=1 Tax=Eumeta variegata TaxID=151549 RepID=A0A4C1WJL2_EUMVA|nr:hypothetical protein EVAR_42792_1 [Eumeta japonica]